MTDETKPSGIGRRAFLRRGSVTVAAATVLSTVPGWSGLINTVSADAPEVDGAGSEADTAAGSLSQPLLAHVKDLTTGEISIFQGTQEFVVHDPGLAGRLAAAAR
jgi:hypothetical protein